MVTWEDYVKKVFAQLKHDPTEAQWPIHLSTNAVKLVAGGERGGKSETGAKECILNTIDVVNGIVWIGANTYDIPRNSEFRYIAQDLLKLGILLEKNIHSPADGDCWLKTETGTLYVTKSAQYLERLGMEAPDFILLCETAQIPFEAFLRFNGRRLEKKAKMVMTGTFEQQAAVRWYEDYYRMWLVKNDSDAKSFSLPSWTNTKIFNPGKHDIVLADGQVIQKIPDQIYREWRERDIDYFMERYAGVPVKPHGLVLKEFDPDVHVGDYPFNRDFPVYTAHDPGYALPGAHAVLACQFISGELYIFDEIYAQRLTVDDMAVACMQRPWWGNVDIRGSCDFAGTQHPGAASYIEQWQKLTGKFLESQKIRVEDGISLLRSFLKPDPLNKNRPKCHIDKRCQGFLSECGFGKSPVYGGGAWLRNEITGLASENNCHSAKAIIYLIVNILGYMPGLGEDNKVQVLSWG